MDSTQKVDIDLLLKQFNEYLELKDKLVRVEKENEEYRNNTSVLRLKVDELILELERWTKSFYVYSNRCRRKTLHKEIGKTEYATEFEKNTVIKSMISQQVRCLGCGYDVVRRFVESREQEIIGEIECFPEDESNFLFMRESLLEISDDHLKEMYEETIRCYNKKLLRPCAQSIQSLINAIAISLQNEETKIQKSIDALAKIGLITTKNSKILKDLNLLGDEVLNKGIKHSQDELKIAITIVENILEDLFIIQKLYDRLLGHRKRR